MDFHITHISGNAKKYVNEVLDSTFLSEGEWVLRFEKALAAKLGISRPVALNSGTTALHLGLVVAGIGPGDEVIVPPQTFIATAIAVLMVGASPIFADIQPETGNLDPRDFERRITDRTKAVIPVHWGGYPCDMDEINEIAARKGIVVLEDAAHAIGATYKGRAIGSISRLTAFSFQAIKHLTTGDGGALACTTEDDERLAKKLRWFGIDRADSPVNTLGEREYDLTELGYKYHMNNLGAALGLGNLEDLETRLTSRNRIVERLRSGLKGTPGLALLSRSSDRQSADWLFIVLVERRESFVERMKERGIPVTVVHNRIDHNTLFGGLRKDLFAMADFDSRQISLPCHEQLRDEDVDAIIAAVKAGW